MATELTKLPADLCQDTSMVDQRPRRSMGTETDEEAEVSPFIALVDEWVEKGFISLTHCLDSILDFLVITYGQVSNLVPIIIDKTKDNIHHLPRVLSISALVEDDTTTIIIDFMRARDEVPVIQKKKKTLCCYPVRFTPQT